MLAAGDCPKPAAIFAFPVGFIGAADSKATLIEKNLGIPFITLKGRMGGSALAAAAINAVLLDGDA
jgi:precorrin-8X/cobalt-precorrin-8 methylmutase